MSTPRRATQHERRYIEHVLAEEQAAWSGFGVLLRALGFVLSALVILGAILEKPALLVVLPITAAFLLVRPEVQRTAPLGAADEIEPVEGVFHGRTVGSGKTARWTWFIGDVAPTLPDHWVKQVRQGDHVRAEGWFRDGAGGLRVAPILVSLNGTLSVEREVPHGLLDLRPNWGGIVAALFLSLGGLFAVLDRVVDRPIVEVTRALLGAGAIALVPALVRWRRNARVLRALRALHPPPPRLRG